MKPQAHQPDTNLKKRKLNHSLTRRKQVFGAVYLQRHLLLIQWTNQMRVNMRPPLLQETFFPVLPDVIQTHTQEQSKYMHDVHRAIFQKTSNCITALFDTLM